MLNKSGSLLFIVFFMTKKAVIYSNTDKYLLSITLTYKVVYDSQKHQRGHYVFLS